MFIHAVLHLFKIQTILGLAVGLELVAPCTNIYYVRLQIEFYYASCLHDTPTHTYSHILTHIITDSILHKTNTPSVDSHSSTAHCNILKLIQLLPLLFIYKYYCYRSNTASPDPCPRLNPFQKEHSIVTRS